MATFDCGLLSLSPGLPATLMASSRHEALKLVNVVRWRGCRACSMSMNGCRGARKSESVVGVCETRTFPAVTAPESAFSQLKSVISALDTDPPCTSSGIIRLQVPILERRDAIDWLHAQLHHLLPCCFFSSRAPTSDSTLFSNNGGPDEPHLVSVAGVGSAVFFRRSHGPFSLEDWKCIKRFLSKDCPLIRAYGAIRFDAKTDVSLEWKDFGSFYFTVPLVEFDELEESSMLAATIAWDNALSWTWQKAVDGLRTTIQQITPCFSKSNKSVPRTAIISFSHVPSKALWDISVEKALQLLSERNSELVKVVLARCSRLITDTAIDPVALLACLKVEGQNAYQFYIQPPDAPAFIGNTNLDSVHNLYEEEDSIISAVGQIIILEALQISPEQLFHRKYFIISSEALAGTRARGVTKVEDVQIGQDLLMSTKDNIEFTVVRETIRRKLEVICNEVLLQPRKKLRKLPRVQHLSAQFLGKLRSEDDEFDVLTSLHPSPAVCGLPTESARQFISESEMFDRGMYAGPVGWFGGRESEFAVGIRSALVGKGFSTLVYAGAGIVEGADPSSEWDELDLKASQFTKLMQCQERVCCG